MRIALPKGRLQPELLTLLAKAGVSITFSHERTYKPEVSDPSITMALVKPRAIPQLVALGKCDAGFCGLDLHYESNYDTVVPLLDLGLNPVEIVVAVPRESQDILSNPPKRALVIATEYEKLADSWAFEHNLSHITVQSWGSTEAYAPDWADIVFDCTETGRTLEANGLVIIDRLFRSTTYLIANKIAMDDPKIAAEIGSLKQRLKDAKEL